MPLRDDLCPSALEQVLEHARQAGVAVATPASDCGGFVVDTAGWVVTARHVVGTREEA